MKICDKCGAEFSDRLWECPQCNALAVNDPQPSSKRRWVARTATVLKAEKGLRCPLCGNTNIVAEGVFYQCKSEAAYGWTPCMRGVEPGFSVPAVTGCGYLAPRADFESRIQSTLTHS